MSIIMFSATGCVRCKVIREFLEERGLVFQEHDALGEGREAFKAFYQQSRRNIHRGPDGVEFPLYFDGEVIRQGLPSILGYLVAGPALEGFFKPGTLHGEWVDGIDVSGGEAGKGERLVEVIHRMKTRGFRLQIETNGLNAALLQKILERKLADRAVMSVKGPLRLYASILQRSVDPEEITKSIALIAASDDHLFVTPVAPIMRETEDPSKISYITPDEVAEAAELIRVVTGDNRQPYVLTLFDPKLADEERLKTIEALPPNSIFIYRTKARRHQVKTEIMQS